MAIDRNDFIRRKRCGHCGAFMKMNRNCCKACGKCGNANIRTFSRTTGHDLMEAIWDKNDRRYKRGKYANYS